MPRLGHYLVRTGFVLCALSLLLVVTGCVYPPRRADVGERYIPYRWTLNEVGQTSATHALRYDVLYGADGFFSSEPVADRTWLRFWDGGQVMYRGAADRVRRLPAAADGDDFHRSRGGRYLIEGDTIRMQFLGSVESASEFKNYVGRVNADGSFAIRDAEETWGGTWRGVWRAPWRTYRPIRVGEMKRLPDW